MQSILDMCGYHQSQSCKRTKFAAQYELRNFQKLTLQGHLSFSSSNNPFTWFFKVQRLRLFLYPWFERSLPLENSRGSVMRPRWNQHRKTLHAHIDHLHENHCTISVLLAPWGRHKNYSRKRITKENAANSHSKQTQIGQKKEWIMNHMKTTG